MIEWINYQRGDTIKRPIVEQVFSTSCEMPIFFLQYEVENIAIGKL